MWKNLPPFILASASPRRAALLHQIGVAHQVVPADFDERLRPGEKPGDYVRRNASGKCAAVSQATRGEGSRLVLAADTIVVHQEAVLEKPKDRQDAASMLARLSASEHEVITGVCMQFLRGDGDGHGPPERKEITVRTLVRFRPLSGREIEEYIRTGEPMDKAGSYGAQGFGASFVAGIVGSYTNVVGLPLTETVEALAAGFGFHMFE